MVRYINAEALKAFFKARNRDLFSSETVCSIIDLVPDEDCLVEGETEVVATVTGYMEHHRTAYDSSNETGKILLLRTEGDKW